jgi:hypothetical protein
MKPTVLAFCSLADLVDWTHADSPSSQCAYLVKLGSPCRFRISCETSNRTKLVVQKYLDVLIGPSETSRESVPQFKFLQELATIQLCNNHKKHHSHAIGQWLNEFTANQASIIVGLAKYYNLGINDTVSGESQNSDDEDDEKDLNLTEEEDTSGEDEEEISVLARQTSSPLTSSMYHTSILATDEIAKDVTCLLQKPIDLKSNDAKPGWIYVISPLAMPGTFKVGYTLKQPQQDRFLKHKQCHGEFEVLIEKLVPHAHRVEQLLLKEFYNQELRKKCENPKCFRVHREILGVDQEILLRCLEKWIEFVESRPYSKQGVLTKKAKEHLPPPALKSYLGCKPTSRRSTGSTPKNKGGSQSSLNTPSKTNLKVPTSAQKDMRAHYTEPDQDDSEISSMIANFHLTPSKSERHSSP